MKNRSLLAIFLLILIGFSVYAFNLNNPLFWDDDEWIKGNLFVHSFSYLKEIFTQDVLSGFGLRSNYYRPLLLLSFAFNYVIHGIGPFGYHLISNGFHIANGILIFLLLNGFIGSRASFIASLLFLIHPAQTEAVSYISGRGDPMSAFFMLLALWLFIKSLNIKILKSRYIYRFLSLFSAALAILSRETAVLSPLFLMIFYISFISKSSFLKSLKGSFVKTLPFFAISAVYFILRLTVFNFENTLNFFSQPNIYSENLFYRLYTFGHALIDYLKIIFYPVGLHMERDLAVATSLFQWPVWLAAVLVLGILYILILSLSAFQLHKSRIWFFSWSWFFVALGPVSGIIPINALIYEHWLYLPLIGFAALAGFYLDKLFEILKYLPRRVVERRLLRGRNFEIAKTILIVCLVVYFSFFAVQSIRRNILWGRPIKFYENILEYSPDSVRILTNLGNLYSEKGDLEKAENLFKQAIESPAGNTFAQPYYNLGNLYRDAGKIDEAIGQYKKAIEIDPSFPFAYQNLAEIYVNKEQDFVSGIEILEKLKEIQPGNPRVYYNLGLLYLTTGNTDLAIENFEVGLKVAPGLDPEIERAISEVLNRIR